MLGIGDRRRAASVVEHGAEELIVALMEAEDAGLEVVPGEANRDASLTARVGGSPVFGRGDGSVRGRAAVVAAVVVVEGRDRHQDVRVEGVHPRQDDARVGFVLAVAKSERFATAG